MSEATSTSGIDFDIEQLEQYSSGSTFECLLYSKVMLVVLTEM